MKKEKFCDGCKNLSPTEEEQSNKIHPLYKANHNCKVYKKTVLHLGRHPRIIRPRLCHKFKKTTPIKPKEIQDWNFTVNLTEEQIGVISDWMKEGLCLPSPAISGIMKDVFEQIEPDYLAQKEKK